MRELSKLRLEYIEQRIHGLSRGKAYQAASGNPNFNSCEKLGSRIELEDHRLADRIKEGLRQKQELIKTRRAEVYQEQLDKAYKIAELDRAERALQERVDKMTPAARDDSQLEIDGVYPGPGQCNQGGTIRGHIPTRCKPILGLAAKQRRREFPW